MKKLLYLVSVLVLNQHAIAEILSIRRLIKPSTAQVVYLLGDYHFHSYFGETQAKQLAAEIALYPDAVLFLEDAAKNALPSDSTMFDEALDFAKSHFANGKGNSLVIDTLEQIYQQNYCSIDALRATPLIELWLSKQMRTTYKKVPYLLKTVYSPSTADFLINRWRNKIAEVSRNASSNEVKQWLQNIAKNQLGMLDKLIHEITAGKSNVSAGDLENSDFAKTSEPGPELETLAYLLPATAPKHAVVVAGENHCEHIEALLRHEGFIMTECILSPILTPWVKREDKDVASLAKVEQEECKRHSELQCSVIRAFFITQSTGAKIDLPEIQLDFTLKSAINISPMARKILHKHQLQSSLF